MSTINETRFESVHRAVAIGLVIVGAYAALERLVGSIALAAQRPEFGLSYTGGLVAWASQNLQYLYHPIDTAPFVPTIYTPLVPMLAGAVTGLTGLPTPGVLRGLGLVSILATGLVIAAAVYGYTEQEWGAAIAGGLYVLSPAVTRSTTLSRVDHLGILFGVLAVVLLIRRSGGRALAGAAALSVLALLVKQSLVVFPLAILVALLAERRWGDAVVFGGVGAVLGALVALPLTLATAGRFWVHTLKLNAAQPWITSQLIDVGGWMTFIHWPVFLVAAIVVWRYRSEHTWIPTSVPILVLVAGGAALVTTGKVGSWVGYFYPVLVASCLTVGFALGRYSPWKDARDVPAQTVLVIGVLLGVQLLLFSTWAPSAVTQPDDQAEVAELVAGASGPVLSEDVSLLTATGHEEAYEPLMMKYLAQSGAWDQRRLNERIRSHEFAYIITWQSMQPVGITSGRWTVAQRSAIATSYVRQRTVGKYHIYTPRTNDE